jgi:hypothetical protein
MKFIKGTMTTEKILHWINKIKAQNKDVKFSYHGGKLKVNQIQHFLHNGYEKNKNDNYDGYQMDKELSGNRFQAYYHPENDHLVTVHRGTNSVHDWITDLKLGLFNSKSGKRFDHAKTQQKKAEEKYKTKNISVLGHSLGSTIAQENGKNANEVITLNKPTTFYDYGKKPKKNQFDIKTNLDPVSALKPLEYKNGNEINIKSKTYNPLTEHKTEVLKRINPDMEIGI